MSLDLQDRPRFSLGSVHGRSKTSGGRLTFKERPSQFRPAAGVPFDAWLGVQSAATSVRSADGHYSAVKRVQAAAGAEAVPSAWMAAEFSRAKVQGKSMCPPKQPREVRAVISGARRFTIFWKGTGAPPAVPQARRPTSRPLGGAPHTSSSADTSGFGAAARIQPLRHESAIGTI
jgi:hypothetical protein